MEDFRKWYVVYTRPRSEKKLEKTLAAKGIESWCPVQKVRSVWSDRIKIIDKPLFPSYLFVNINIDEQKIGVLETAGIVHFIKFRGELSTITDLEIFLLKKTLDEKNIRIIITNRILFDAESSYIEAEHFFSTSYSNAAAEYTFYLELHSIDRVLIAKGNFG